MVNWLFDVSVEALRIAARLTGTTYEEINVIIFLVLWPALTLGLLAALWRQHHLLRAARGSSPNPY